MTKEERKEWMAKPLRAFCLSYGALNRLEYMGIVTMGDLVRKSKLDLLRIRNFGKKTVAEINEFVEGLGFHMGEAEDETPALSNERKRMLWECFRDVALEATKEFMRAGNDDSAIAPAAMSAFYTVRAFEEYIVRVERALAENPDLFDYNLYNFDQIRSMLYPEMGEDVDKDDNGNAN